MEVFEAEMDDGRILAAIELPMEPYGTHPVYADDNTEDSRGILQQLAQSWIRLWPEMRTLFEDCAKEIDLDDPVDSVTLHGQISRMEPGVWMADRSEIYLSLRSFSYHPPEWDFFLKDGQIIHFQPVF